MSFPLYTVSRISVRKDRKTEGTGHQIALKLGITSPSLRQSRNVYAHGRTELGNKF